MARRYGQEPRVSIAEARQRSRAEGLSRTVGLPKSWLCGVDPMASVAAAPVSDPMLVAQPARPRLVVPPVRQGVRARPDGDRRRPRACRPPLVRAVDPYSYRRRVAGRPAPSRRRAETKSRGT